MIIVLPGQTGPLSDNAAELMLLTYGIGAVCIIAVFIWMWFFSK